MSKLTFHEKHTDFDKHLDMLENSDGEVFFFHTNDNPARFQKNVVDVVLESEPPEIVLVFHKGVGEKKSRSISRSISRRIVNGLNVHFYKTHLFIFPSALFQDTKKVYAEEK